MIRGTRVFIVSLRQIRSHVTQYVVVLYVNHRKEQFRRKSAKALRTFPSLELSYANDAPGVKDIARSAA
jgi:hypothetical protein